MDAGQVWGSSVCLCVSDSEIGCPRRRVCDSESVCNCCLTGSHTCLPESLPGGSGGCQTGWLVCGRDRLCITAYTRLSGPKGATWHPSWAGWQAQRLWWGRMGRFRGEESRVPILPAQPHQADRQMEKNVHTRGRPVAARQRDCSVHRKQVLLVSARVWQEVAFGWQEVGFSTYQPRPRGRRAVIWG